MTEIRVVAWRLRALRRRAGLTQRELARVSGVGEKTVSYFETGARIRSVKLVHLNAILGVYGITLAEFFADWHCGEPKIQQGRAA